MARGPASRDKSDELEGKSALLKAQASKRGGGVSAQVRFVSQAIFNGLATIWNFLHDHLAHPRRSMVCFSRRRNRENCDFFNSELF
jgi:hypothetical protein